MGHEEEAFYNDNCIQDNSYDPPICPRKIGCAGVDATAVADGQTTS